MDFLSEVFGKYFMEPLPYFVVGYLLVDLCRDFISRGD